MDFIRFAECVSVTGLKSKSGGGGIKMVVGFIGAGNMGGALIEGALGRKVIERDGIVFCEKDDPRAQEILQRFNIKRLGQLAQLIRESEIVFLCVKPQDSKDVLEEVGRFIKEGQLLVSIMAGVSIELIQRLLGRNAAVVRAMPNTPALIGEGITAICHRDARSSERLELVKAIFSSVGEVVEVKEEWMDAITAISGSGPGFVFRMMEVFVGAGVELGIPQDISKRLVVQTFLGASRLSKVSSKDLGELRGMVTSKGGTTQAGLEKFSELKVDAALTEVLKAATFRAKELNRELFSKLSQ
jgi:pyrroline-5-carboxylate reductase